MLLNYRSDQTPCGQPYIELNKHQHTCVNINIELEVIQSRRAWQATVTAPALPSRAPSYHYCPEINATMCRCIGI